MPQVGRPSLYQERYCELIEAHMADGLSATAFAGVIGVDKDTIHEWKRVHPAFSAALKKGMCLRVLWWEKRLCKADKSDAVPIIFALKNIEPDEWRDRRDVELSGPGGAALFDSSLVLAAMEVVKRKQVVDVQIVEPKQIVDQTVNKEQK